MADNLTDRGRHDRMQIAVDQEQDMRYWSKKFGVTVEQLREAMKGAGPRVVEIERHLKGPRPSSGAE